MRLLNVSAIVLLLAAGTKAQSLSEHAAAAAGATIGTAAGKPLSNAITKIFGTVDDDTKKAAATKANAPKTQPKESTPSQSPSITTPSIGGSNAPAMGSSSPAPSSISVPVVTVKPAPAPIRRVPT